jgi:hypothetical protein
MRTHIVMILDRSGSMGSIAADTIGGVNKFVADQQAVPGEATFSLVQFDHEYGVVHDFAPISVVVPLTASTFVPRGTTALLDAVARTINDTGARLSSLPASSRPEKVICVIVTDGQENASRNASRSQVFDQITHQRDVYKWDFVFLGANQDAIAEAGKIGIAASATMDFAASASGVKSSYDSLSHSVSRSRSMGVAMAFSDDDRKKATQK